MAKLAKAIAGYPDSVELTTTAPVNPTGRVVIADADSAASMATMHQRPTHNEIAIYSHGSRLEDGACLAQAVPGEWRIASGVVGNDKEAYNAELLAGAGARRHTARRTSSGCVRHFTNAQVALQRRPHGVTGGG
ncbi:hypothetical protein FN846DRAFT_913990 [Sphaerosporella brunnea]|uniref:Uncharacterized protein n=1 Tax=Sphaerosporella brunnea TaxID=1250544 RepID=A0A5J5EE23_9PEZI|nr:hypothetical protein FN846DRAFT_913990 [Sphaerosporella brunnea]